MSIVSRLFSRRRAAALVGAGTALCLLATPAGLYFGPGGSIAHASGGGNNNKGDVWVDNVGQPSGPGHEMDPHLACADINLWGAAMADPSGTYTIDGWPPSGSMLEAYPLPVAPATAPYTLPGQPAGHWRYSGTGSQILQVISVQALIANAIANGDAPINRQGFHFKLQFVQDPQKHKTFWVDCPAISPPVPNCVPTKVVDPTSGTSVPIGDTLKYTVTATNNSSASGPCVVTDAITTSGGATYSVVIPPSVATATKAVSVTFADPTFTWDVGTLAPGASATITMTLKALSPGTITNTAAVASPECTDSPDAPCTASVHNPIPPATPNCVPTKSVVPASGSTVPVGGDLVYTVTATNDSSTAAPCVVTDAITTSGGATYSVVIPPSVTTASKAASVTFADPTFTWDVGTLAPGASATITMTLKALSAGTITNTAAVASPQCVATATAPCSSTVNNTVITPGPFAVAKTVVPTGSVPIGTVLAYTVTVTNTGSTAASPSADLADNLTLVGGATYALVSGPTVSAGTVTGPTGAWSWDLTTTSIAPGTSATFAVSIRALTPGTLNNTAVLPGSNCPSANLPAPCSTTTPVNLLLSKTVSETVAQVGDVVTYVVTLTNPTSNAAVDITVDDVMSGTAGFTVNDGTPGSHTVDSFIGSPVVPVTRVGADHYTWTYPTVAAGAIDTIQYTATITGAGSTATQLNGDNSVVNTATTAGLPPVVVTTTVPTGSGGGVLGITTTPTPGSGVLGITTTPTPGGGVLGITTTPPPGGVLGITSPATGGFSRMNTTIAGFLLLGGLTLILMGMLARKPERQVI